METFISNPWTPGLIVVGIALLISAYFVFRNKTRPRG